MSQAPRKLLQALEARENDLRERIAEHRDALEVAVHAHEPAGDGADKAFGRAYAEVEQDLIVRSLKELAEIAAVRDRLDNGTHGKCVDCAEPILPARLEVNPSAPRCATCQARHEKLSGGI